MAAIARRVPPELFAAFAIDPGLMPGTGMEPDRGQFRNHPPPTGADAARSSRRAHKRPDRLAMLLCL